MEPPCGTTPPASPGPRRCVGLRRSASTGALSLLSREPGEGAPPGGEGPPRLGGYTLEERRARILRFQQKRTARNFDRKVKYGVRKALADGRQRVGGRFVKSGSGAALAQDGLPADGPLHEESPEGSPEDAGATPDAADIGWLDCVGDQPWELQRGSALSSGWDSGFPG